jgi:UDP-glucose 4-epimerase
LRCEKLIVIRAFFNDYPKLPSLISAHPDVFYHFAWQGVWGDSFSDYSVQFHNAVYCVDAYRIASLLGCAKFVFASTVNVLEAKKILLDNDGNKKMRKTMTYAMAKLSAEMACKTLCSRGGIPFNCAYLAMAYGPNNYSLMVPNVVIFDLLHGVTPKLIKGDGLYDLIYIDDIAEGFAAIGRRGRTGKTYYLGHNSLKSFRSIFSDIKDVIDPTASMQFGVYPDDNSIDYSLVDIKDLEKDTGFTATSPFRNSVLETVNWIEKNESYFFGGKK